MSATLPLPVYIAANGAIYFTALAAFTLIPSGFYRAAERAGLSVAARNGLTIATTIALVFWFLYSLNALSPQIFGNQFPVSYALRALTCFLLPILLGSLLIFTVPALRAVNRAMPSHWPVAIQIFRILGGVFLLYLPSGSLAPEFALWAGLGDILVGVLAPVAAWSLRKQGRYAVLLAVGWNLLGIADFISAIGHAMHSNARLGYPIGMIPGYFVPLCILMHIFSLRNLAVSHPRTHSHQSEPVETVAAVHPV